MTRKSFVASLIGLAAIPSVSYGTTNTCPVCRCMPCACRVPEIPTIRPLDIDLSHSGVYFTIQKPVTNSIGKPYLLMFTPYGNGYAALVDVETGLAEINHVGHLYDDVITWPGNNRNFGWIKEGGVWVRDWVSSTPVPMPGFSR